MSSQGEYAPRVRPPSQAVKEQYPARSEKAAEQVQRLKPHGHQCRLVLGGGGPALVENLKPGEPPAHPRSDVGPFRRRMTTFLTTKPHWWWFLSIHFSLLPVSASDEGQFLHVLELQLSVNRLSYLNTPGRTE